jgi:hypothetical protein
LRKVTKTELGAATQHPPGIKEVRPTMRNVIVLVPIIAALAVGIASGADAPAVSHTITIVDDELIQPSTLTMRSGDALEFNNYSTQPMVLVFTEPTDPLDDIRCRLVDTDAAGEGRTAWQLDDSRSGPQLSAIIPPGRSASSCWLAPGRYAFIMRKVGRDVRAPAYTSVHGVIAVQP